MNPYAMLASGNNTSIASSLAARLAAWHDSMVLHERRLRTGRSGDVCDDECAHVEARTLWAEALAAFGNRAHELVFLRSRATSPERPRANTAAAQPRESERAGSGRSADGEWKWAARHPRGRPVVSPSARPQRTTTEAEL